MTLYQNCSNRSAPLNQMAAKAKKRKTFKRLPHLNQCTDFEIILQERWPPELKIEKLLLNQKMDFEIIIQECFLGDPLPK